MEYECDHVEGEAEKEEQEELVVTIAKAVIDECAVMIESLDALITVVAMPSVFRS